MVGGGGERARGGGGGERRKVCVCVCACGGGGGGLEKGREGWRASQGESARAVSRARSNERRTGKRGGHPPAHVHVCFLFWSSGWGQPVVGGGRQTLTASAASPQV